MKYPQNWLLRMSTQVELLNSQLCAYIIWDSIASSCETHCNTQQHNAMHYYTLQLKQLPILRWREQANFCVSQQKFACSSQHYMGSCPSARSLNFSLEDSWQAPASGSPALRFGVSGWTGRTWIYIYMYVSWWITRTHCRMNITRAHDRDIVCARLPMYWPNDIRVSWPVKKLIFAHIMANRYLCAQSLRGRVRSAFWKRFKCVRA